MVIGIGVDIVQISRIDKVIKNFRERLARRILSCDEIDRFADSLLDKFFLAKRFAAKEAISKALGTGIGKISFKDITIINDEFGKPIVHLSENCFAKSLNIHLSIADDYPQAIAFAIIDK